MSKDPTAVEFQVPGVHRAVARWVYEGEAAERIRRLKYHRSTSVIGQLADELCSIAPACDLLSWIPATPERRRDRGFDQSELLARAVARRLGVRSLPLLRRVDHRAQTSRDLVGRLQGPSFAHVGRNRRSIGRILLIDDVSTTGSTLASAALTLSELPSRVVSAAVVAKVVGKGATQPGFCRSIV